MEDATVLGSGRVDQALGLAAAAGRFADDDLLSILEHLAASKPAGEVVRADEAHSVQSGTTAGRPWASSESTEGDGRPGVVSRR